MSLEELDKLERQRRDADQRYNDALTAFDAALVHAAPPGAPGLVADSLPGQFADLLTNAWLAAICRSIYALNAFT